ncbi:hypothetical protein [Arcobacter sp. FWKO B]|uniref:hypothetical protein n=1 Tax=Arcobacter sp. FWKO B TaxID=2593672 RepID=UPI0018A36320|nr:hypothetical protein [Arcobacter sp. FWKO B]QOG12450.1 hypothetical protein FWKOB_06935 [Arcobacter sp. FWKO B]
MLIELWGRYEKYILKYSDTQLKSWYALLVSMVPFLILNYIIFYFMLNYNVSYNHMMIIGLSIPMGRLLYAYIIYKNNLYFGDGYNWFTLVLFIFGMLVAIIGLTYLIIKDINGGFEDKQQEEHTYRKIQIDTNISNKYDYLLQNNKSE